MSTYLVKVYFLMKSFILSSKGLKNLVLSDDDEFTFIIGEQETSMKRIFAEFLSPKVSQLHKADPTVNFLDLNDMVESKELNESREPAKLLKIAISLIEKLFEGEKVEINEDQEFPMRFLSILLGNKEMFDKINELYVDGKDLEVDHYLNDLELFENLTKSQISFDYSSLINIISSHFYSIDKSKLLRFKKSTLYSIISNENLKIENEDSLFELICQIFEEESEYDSESSVSLVDFYEQVEFTNLSIEKLSQFVDTFNTNEISQNLWRKLSQCFYFNYQNNVSKQFNEKRYFGVSILYDNNKDHSFKGIINDLTKKCGGNVSDKKVVDVTCFSYFGSNYAKNAVDFDNDKKYYESINNQTGWIKYDFKELKISPTHYSIKSACNKGSANLMNWVIEGSNSNNDDDWIVLDTRNNIKSIDGLYYWQTFDVQSRRSNEYFRYLRLRGTGPNAGGDNFFKLASLEYFGFLKYE